MKTVLIIVAWAFDVDRAYLARSMMVAAKTKWQVKSRREGDKTVRKLLKYESRDAKA